MSIYLDNAATTQVCPEAARAALDAMTEHYGNPSSTHALGREAKKSLDAARARVAKALGCTPAELYFTSCGSEGDNWAIRVGAQYNSRRGKHILSSTVEHPAVLQCLDDLERQGFTVTRLSPRPDGSMGKADVLNALREDTCMVTLMLVNNETGAVTDIPAIAAAVRAHAPHCLIHTDAVQGFLKLSFSAGDLGADLITVSGHKIHAPKGIGALYIRRGLNLPPYILGGGQESGRRSGTEALPNIAAFGAACAAAQKTFADDARRMSELRRHAIERLTAENDGLVILGGNTPVFRVPAPGWDSGAAPHILSLSLPGYRSEVLMNCLEADGILVSKSSACKKGRRSHVLEAMGLPADVIDGALRVSLSRFTTRDEIDAFCNALSNARATLRHR